jgi:hypothetical protein
MREATRFERSPMVAIYDQQMDNSPWWRVGEEAWTIYNAPRGGLNGFVVISLLVGSESSSCFTRVRDIGSVSRRSLRNWRKMLFPVA